MQLSSGREFVLFCRATTAKAAQKPKADVNTHQEIVLIWPIRLLAMHCASLGDMQIYGTQLDMIKAMHTEQVIALWQENDVKSQ